jgi:hypothetical protein
VKFIEKPPDVLASEFGGIVILSEPPPEALTEVSTAGLDAPE